MVFTTPPNTCVVFVPSTLQASFSIGVFISRSCRQGHAGTPSRRLSPLFSLDFCWSRRRSPWAWLCCVLSWWRPSTPAAIYGSAPWLFRTQSPPTIAGKRLKEWEWSSRPWIWMPAAPSRSCWPAADRGRWGTHWHFLVSFLGSRLWCSSSCVRWCHRAACRRRGGERGRWGCCLSLSAARGGTAWTCRILPGICIREYVSEKYNRNELIKTLTARTKLIKMTWPANLPPHFLALHP